MSKDKKRMEFYAGVPWVNITPQQARNHPKGKPGLVLWGIALFFIVTGSWKFYAAWDFGLAFWLILLAGIWPFLAGAGLLARVPWSVFMAIVSAGVTVWALFRSSRATAELYGTFEAATQLGFLHALFGVDSYGDGFFVILLVELLIHVGILFYLMDGDRPNLIYRHRYRQYSIQDRSDDG